MHVHVLMRMRMRIDDTTTTLSNKLKKNDYYSFVSKVNMATNKAMWVDDIPLVGTRAKIDATFT